MKEISCNAPSFCADEKEARQWALLNGSFYLNKNQLESGESLLVTTQFNDVVYSVVIKKGRVEPKYNFLVGDYLIVGKISGHLVAILNEDDGLLTYKKDNEPGYRYKKVQFEKCRRL